MNNQAASMQAAAAAAAASGKGIKGAARMKTPLKPPRFSKNTNGATQSQVGYIHCTTTIRHYH
jgi:hypothetical protein